MPHTTQSTATDEELKHALEVFETSLETPVVSGELAAWIEEIQKAWGVLSNQVCHQIEQIHPQEFDQIGEQDPELLPKTELLKEEDVAIECDRDALSQTVARAAQHVPKLEPDEEKAQRHMQKLIDEGLAFVGRVRKQRVAIRTWFTEAFHRDRGPVD